MHTLSHATNLIDVKILEIRYMYTFLHDICKIVQRLTVFGLDNHWEDELQKQQVIHMQGWNIVTSFDNFGALGWAINMIKLTQSLNLLSCFQKQLTIYLLKCCLRMISSKPCLSCLENETIFGEPELRLR